MTTAQVNTVDDLHQREAWVSLRNRFTSPDWSPAGAERNAQVQTAGSNEQPRLVATMSLAFSTDPAVRWMYPEPEKYLAYFPLFVSAFGGRAFECGTAHFIGDVQAAALWLPPGVEPDEQALMSLFERTVPESQQEVLFAIFEQMGHYHPHEPQLVSAADWRRSCPATEGLWLHSARARSQGLRPRQHPCLLGILQPGEHPALSAPWLRSAGDHSGEDLPAGHTHVPPSSMKSDHRQ